METEPKSSLVWKEGEGEGEVGTSCCARPESRPPARGTARGHLPEPGRSRLVLPPPPFDYPEQKKKKKKEEEKRRLVLEATTSSQTALPELRVAPPGQDLTAPAPPAISDDDANP